LSCGWRPVEGRFLRWLDCSPAARHRATGRPPSAGARLGGHLPWLGDRRVARRVVLFTVCIYGKDGVLDVKSVTVVAVGCVNAPRFESSLSSSLCARN